MRSLRGNVSAAAGEDDGAPYKVWVFFPDDTHYLIDDGLDAEAAVKCAKRQTETVGARIGTTRRIIIEDKWGYTCFQWERDKGVMFPKVANKEKADG